MAHSSGRSTKDEVPLNFLFENSAFLIAGAIAALVWAYYSPQTHHNFFHFPLKVMFLEDHSEEHHAAHGDEHAVSGHAAADHAGMSSSSDTEHSHAPNENVGEPAHGEEGSNSAGGAESHDSESVASVEGEQAGEPPVSAESGLVSESPVKAEAVLGELATDPVADASEAEEEHGHPITLHFIINDILMALFFAIATKEVWESMLPGGSLANPRKAALPLLATFGGVAGPAIIYCIGAALCGWATYGKGWAVPCATDIAFSYLVARLIFGSTHPAIAFLLLLAIADDAIGLVIIAVFYPQGPLKPEWLLLTLAAMLLTYTMRKCRIHSHWWYMLLPGVMSWFSFYEAGIHAALGLVPIIPLMPHAQTDLGVFAKEELDRTDTLNEFEHWWKRPVELNLGLFGLCNAAVPLTGVGAGTWLVLAGLMLGKPLGITLCTYLGEKFFNLKLPESMDYKQVVTIGCVAAIGFTVALFVSESAFSTSTTEVLNAVKMGALLSFGAAIISIGVAKGLGIKRWRGGKPQS